MPKITKDTPQPAPAPDWQINGLGTMSRIRDELFTLEQTSSRMIGTNEGLQDSVDDLVTVIETLVESIDNLKDMTEKLTEQLRKQAEDGE